MKDIHLGNKNNSSGGRYQIKDAERVLATLLTMPTSGARAFG